MKRVVFGLVLLMVICEGVHGQQAYREPPQEVVDIIDAAPEPAVSFSPDRQWMLLLERKAMPSIADISRRMLRLAGMRIDPAANSGFQTSFYHGVSIRTLANQKPVQVKIPAGNKISGISWSHDSKTVAMILVDNEGSHLWVFEASPNPTARRLAKKHLDGNKWHSVDARCKAHMLYAGSRESRE